MVQRAIVIFPEFPQIELIQQLREAYDPLASEIRPHVTLVFPFESALSTEQIALHVNKVSQMAHPFRLSMRGVTGDASEYLFLNVKQGNDQLIALHDQLYTGILAPYFTARMTYVPHLTVGRVSGEAIFNEALEKIQDLTTSFTTEVGEMAVYRIGEKTGREIEYVAKLS